MIRPDVIKTGVEELAFYAKRLQDEGVWPVVRLVDGRRSVVFTEDDIGSAWQRMLDEWEAWIDPSKGPGELLVYPEELTYLKRRIRIARRGEGILSSTLKLMRQEFVGLDSLTNHEPFDIDGYCVCSMCRPGRCQTTLIQQKSDA